MNRFLFRISSALAGGVVVFAAIMAASAVMITRNQIRDAILFAQIASIYAILQGLVVSSASRPRNVMRTGALAGVVLLGAAFAKRYLGERGHVPTLLVMYGALIVLGWCVSVGSYRWMSNAVQTTA